MSRSIALVVVLTFLVGMPLTAAELPRPGDEGLNVLLTLTVVDTAEDGEENQHSVSALALDGRSARMVTGWRLPIPESTLSPSGPAAAEGVPVTSFSYQDVGLSATLQGRAVGANRLRVSGRVEVSAVDEEASAGAPAPKLGTFRHDFEVVLLDGVDAVIAEATKPQGGSLSLTISASIQD